METVFCVIKKGKETQLKTFEDMYSPEVFGFQGSDDWHKFRSGIQPDGATLWPAGSFGASSAAPLMDQGYGGKGFQALLLELSGFKKTPKAGGKAIQRGNDNESLALNVANQILGVDHTPVCAYNKELPVHRVSFDGVGFSPEMEVLSHLEIKIPFTKEKFDELSSTVKPVANCPEDLGAYFYYYAQVQMQLALLPLNMGNLFIYYPEDNTYILIQVPKNQEYIDEMLSRLSCLHKQAWELFNGNSEDEEASELLEEILQVKKEKDALYREHSKKDKIYKSLIKDDLSEYLEDRTVISNGHVAISVTTPKDSIDWKRLAEDYLMEKILTGEISLDGYYKQVFKRYTVLEKV